MIEVAAVGLVDGSGSFALPFADSSSSSMLRLVVFIAIFVAPAILKALKESAKLISYEQGLLSHAQRGSNLRQGGQADGKPA